MVVTTLSANKLENRSAGIADVRVARARISTDVREACNFGDLYADNYGAIHIDPNVYETDLSSGYAFPGEGNPLYSSSGPNFASTDWVWTGWPNQWTAPPYILDEQTLILQQPKIFTAPENDPLSLTYDSNAAQNSFNGLPLKIGPREISETQPESTIPNVDTVIYKLIQDPNEPNEYILQRARFVGVGNVPESTNKIMISQPQTILSGIIGPRPSGNSTGIPEIFSYYGTYSNNPPRLNTPAVNIPPPGSSIPANYIRGVGIDLEIKKPDSSTGNSNAAYQQRLGIHAEAFLRHSSNISAKNPYD